MMTGAKFDLTISQKFLIFCVLLVFSQLLFQGPAFAGPSLKRLLPSSGPVELVAPHIPQKVLQVSEANKKAAMEAQIKNMSFTKMGDATLSVEKSSGKVSISSKSSSLGSLFKEGFEIHWKKRRLDSKTFGSSSKVDRLESEKVWDLAGFWVPGYTFQLAQGHVHLGKIRSQSNKCLMGVNLTQGAAFEFVYLRYICN